MPRKPPPNTISPQMVAALKQQIQHYIGLIDRATACGIDCDLHRAVAQNAWEQLDRIDRFIIQGQTPTPAEIQSGRDLSFLTPPPQG